MISDIPGSRKLLKLTVNSGDHNRCILAGMKQERANPQKLVGRQALFIVNLEPKRMAGVLGAPDTSPRCECSARDQCRSRGPQGARSRARRSG
ncbi:MAG: hypothetical protein L0271_23110 [Gemmatimonadetes bacterium]|nr:hypothetical protein [Gemmatimonadota bacterium]